MAIENDDFIPLGTESFLHALDRVGRAFIPDWDGSETQPQTRSYPNWSDQDDLVRAVAPKMIRTQLAQEHGRAWRFTCAFFGLMAARPALKFEENAIQNPFEERSLEVVEWLARGGEIRSTFDYCSRKNMDLNTEGDALCLGLITNKISMAWMVFQIYRYLDHDEKLDSDARHKKYGSADELISSVEAEIAETLDFVRAKSVELSEPVERAWNRARRALVHFRQATEAGVVRATYLAPAQAAIDPSFWADGTNALDALINDGYPIEADSPKGLLFQLGANLNGQPPAKQYKRICVDIRDLNAFITQYAPKPEALRAKDNIEARGIEILQDRYRDPTIDAVNVSKAEHLAAVNHQLASEFDGFEPYKPKSRAWTDRIWIDGTREIAASGDPGRKPSASRSQ